MMMEYRMTFYLILVILSFRQDCVLAKFVHNIRISTHGKDSQQCLIQNNTPCKSLEFVFNHTMQNESLQHSTLIIVETGNYTLNRSYCFEKLTDFAIVGSSYFQERAFDHVHDECCKIKIQCSKGSGLAFLRCESLLFSNLIFEKCGSWQNNTSINNPKFLTALFVAYCNNLQIFGCWISKSPGAGVTLYDVGGEVLLENTTFAENYALDSWNFTYGLGTVRAGGGLHFELTYCGALYPFDCASQETDKYNNNSSYTIRNCTFVRNNSTMGGGFHQTFNKNPRGKHFDSIGRGGGISFLIKGNATGNRFVVENCRFHGNTADWGAGYALYFQDKSNKNFVLVTDSLFDGNIAKFGGGAVKCATTIFETFHNLIEHEANHYTHINCTFHNNTAKEGWGGAYSAFGSTSYIDAKGWRHHLTSAFINCTWSENSATVGAAIGVLTKPIELWRQKPGSMERGFSFAIKLVDNLFYKNTIIRTRENRVTIYGMGTIYSVTAPIIMIGNVNFTENSDTALVLDSAYAEINGHVLFYNNTGINGGAVGIYGMSAFVLDEGAQLTFRENYASSIAGAVYVRTAGPDIAAFNETIFQRHDCFFRYYNGSSHPDEWDVKVEFQGNRASLNIGRTIFTNTLQFCRFGRGGPINDAFKNWTKFYFYTNNGSLSKDSLEIATEAVQIFVQEHEWKNVSPNEEIKPTIHLFDERNNSVYGLIKISIDEGNSNQNVTIPDNVSPYYFVKDRIQSIWLYGKPYSNYNINIASINSQVIKLTVQNLSLKRCPPGFVELGKVCQCLTLEKATSGISRCDKNGKSLYLRKGYWGGPRRTGDGVNCPFSVFQCPDGYCMCSSNNTDGLTNKCECVYNASNQCVFGREGNLCGKCRNGWGVMIGSNECSSKCDGNNIFLLIPYFLLLTILVFIILFFKLDFFSGYLNCWLYTYQITYLLLPKDFFRGDPFMNFIIRLANGQFVFGSWCLWSEMTDLQKLSFGYVAPFYQILSLFVFAKLSSRFAIFQGNFFRPFCTILVLSYSEIVSITFKQLHPVYFCSHWHVYIQGNTRFFRDEHILHASLAIIVLLLVVLPFPIILAYSSFFISRSRYFAQVCIPLLDVLQSCYRTERSWCAALYIICRLLAVLIHTYIPDTSIRYKTFEIFCIIVLVIFLFLRPYKNETLTHIDTFYLSFLVLISLLAEVIITCLFYVSLFYNICFYLIHILLYIPFLYAIVLLYFHVRNKKQGNQLAERQSTMVQTGTQTGNNGRYEPL